MGITQPAVSRSIRELETILALKLFERHGRGTRMTAEGKALLGDVEGGLGMIERGLTKLANPNAIRETVAIGAMLNVCSNSLPRIVSEFKKQHPSVVVRVEAGRGANLLAHLRSGELDIVIGRLSSATEMRRLAFERLYDESIVFVTSATHPLAEVKEGIRFHDLLDYPFLLPPTGTIARTEIDRVLSAKGVTLDNVTEVFDTGFLRTYLQSTNCIAATVKAIVEEDLLQEKMALLPITVDGLRSPVGIMTNPSKPKTDVSRAMLTAIRTQVLP